MLHVKVFSTSLCYTSEGAILVRTIYSTELCNHYVREIVSCLPFDALTLLPQAVESN